MVNLHKPHLFILPEDRANAQMAVGFALEVEPTKVSQMMILREARGWPRVLELFKSVHMKELEIYRKRFLILLIDFDGDEDRRGYVDEFIREVLINCNDVANRVFVLGVRTEPENLRSALGHRSFQKIGMTLAQDCREETETPKGWGHELLQHNREELDRLRLQVRHILF
jgi:hypothetical protein